MSIPVTSTLASDKDMRPGEKTKEFPEHLQYIVGKSIIKCKK